MPRADERLVEVVEVEDDLLAGARSLRLAPGERVDPVDPEVLEVRVAHDPSLARRAHRERRLAYGELVEERRRSASEGQRRHGHAGHLARKEARKTGRAL